MSKTVVLAVGGGIAAYKSAALCSLLRKRGYGVQVLMTAHACEFVQPLTFQTLSGRAVLTDTFIEPDAAEIAHIAVADRADLFLVAPATANLLAKLATGLADDVVSTTALAVTGPVCLAPAMNVHMLAHPAVEQNLQTLRARGAIVIDPRAGLLACGYTGKGRLAEPEDIAAVVDAILQPPRPWAGKTVVVTAGPTVEDIDPVRFLSNRSSGKMGYALAAVAAQLGARVVLVSGPTALSTPANVERVDVRSTADMLLAVRSRLDAADVVVSAAAPADFRPVERQERKIKKDNGAPTLALAQTPDILRSLLRQRRPGQLFIGFAAETDDIVEHGWQKLRDKQLDWIAVNNVLQADAGFGVDTNRVILLGRDGSRRDLPLLTKWEVAAQILNVVGGQWLSAGG